MKRESLEKIRNILEHLFELFIFILIMLITFVSLSVHAEESNVQQELTGKVTVSVVNDYYGYDGVVTYEFKNNVNLDNFDVCGFLNTRVSDTDSSVTTQTIDFLYRNKKDGDISFVSDAVVITNVSTSGNVKPYYSASQTLQSFCYDQSRVRVNSNIVWFSFYEYEGGTYPVAKDNASAQNYLLTGDTSGIINGGGSIDNPDFEDSAYAFTGFTANNKMTATWTGTTERSYLKDQEVEEYVRLNYYFADKEAQDTVKQADAYPDEFATSDKTLTIDVSGLKPDDENWFLRYIRITPCYRQAGLGAWGDFYHGSDVYVYFDVNGKVESIVQNSVPTDGEVIGNNISLIGFRYDTSFHAEFVDVWSNAVNCSAFDLGGSQYLSLGVKALYYNGQSKDIDFVSLDRKNLVWDKTFDSFKTFNGSGIKQLFFTPYIKTGVNNPWNKGNSIVIDFDVNGNATSSFDTGDDGTVHLSDFKLTGVVWNKPMLAYGTITWTGTTANSDMSIVPDSDTLVVCSYPVYDSSLNESYETYDTVTIGKGSIRVYIDSLIDKYTNAGKTWNGEMWLTPCYKKGGVLYMGEPVIVNCTKGTVSDIEVDESTGTANQVDKTDENKSYADAILSSGNNFFSIVKGLIASMQQLPELIATLFSFLPGWVNALIAGSIFIIFVCRILGR